MNPFFSVIIPYYNPIDTLFYRCLDSVFTQTFYDYEVIVVNDGSDKEIDLDNYNIRHFNLNHSGVSAARNFGISKATGKYILFMDYDDFYTSDDIFKQLYEKLVNNNIDILYCGFNYGSTKHLINGYSENEFRIIEDKTNFIYSILFPQCESKILSREFITKNNIQYKSYTHGEDAVFLLDCFIKADNIAVYNITVSNYDLTETSVTHICNYSAIKNLLQAKLEFDKVAKANGLSINRLIFGLNYVLSVVNQSSVGENNEIQELIHNIQKLESNG